MKKHISYPKIVQFRNVVSNINREITYTGLDEEGKAIYDPSIEKPTLTFKGTVKLHGTNASVCFNSKDGFWIQSRRNIITVEKDNAGFAFFAESKKEEFQDLIDVIILENNIDINKYTVSIYGEWAGCFTYDTPILLSDGTTRNIGQIVKNKEQVEVLSYNPDLNKLESNKIINWFENGKTEDWLKIGYKRRKRGGQKPYIKVTPNHKVFTEKDNKIVEVFAGELQQGDTIFTNGDLVSTNQLDFIRGTLMGDASISDIRHLQVSHSEDSQPYYNTFIKKLLGNISSDTKRTSGFGSNMKGIFTKSLNEVEDIYYETYLQGNKKPNIEFLNKLNCKSLAIWYMDDGTLSNHKGKNRQEQSELMTMGWELSDNELISAWLSSRGYENYICKDASYEELKYFIRFTPKGTIRFLSDIYFYMIKEFDYKLPTYLRNKEKFNWFEEYGEYEKGLVRTKVETIEKYTPNEDYKKVRYDIEVENNHNYFANRILVHNSGIQKGVGISELDKAFYVFGVKVSKPQDKEFNAYWIDSSNVKNTECRIFNVEDYETYSIDVDFNMPQLAQNKFAEITEKVEKECPISKAFGIDNGLGEGVVWSVEYKNNVHRFKCKGEKHSVSKVKTLANVDVEKLKTIQDFVEYSVTQNRFDQAIENVFGKEDLDIKKMGDFIRWFIKDITAEELDTMLENGLEPKDVNKYISTKVREMFFKAQSEY